MRVRPSLAASTTLHAAILILTMVSFTGAKPFDPALESVPVDVISASDFTKLTKGSPTAEKSDAPKVVAEKVDTPDPADDPKAKVTEKPPVEATAPPPPPPPPPPEETVKAEKAPPKAEEAPPKEQPKADVALKNEPKKEEKPQEEAKAPPPPPVPPKKPSKIPPKPVETASENRDFNADQIKELLDKRTPQRRVASASQLSATAALGAPRGDSATLSQSEIDAFRARLRQCWNVQGLPANQRDLFVLINVSLNSDGTVSGHPQIIGGKDSPYWRPLADSAMRALLSCQPYTMLRPEKYDLWKSMELKFTPQMFDG